MGCRGIRAWVTSVLSLRECGTHQRLPKVESFGLEVSVGWAADARRDRLGGVGLAPVVQGVHPPP